MSRKRPPIISTRPGRSATTSARLLDATATFLADLAAGGRALEFGVGTGRRQQGVEVSGVDLSEAMVKRLKAKPGGDQIEVAIGDFANTSVPGPFKLVYLVFNTIENLTTQDAQVACFRNAAGHLETGGCFVIEVAVPGIRGLAPGETVRPFTVTPSRLGFDEYDVADQGLVSHHYYLDKGRVDAFSLPFRYVWPAELDLMARLAGMELRERWGDWGREPFTSESTKHVSVWQKTDMS